MENQTIRNGEARFSCGEHMEKADLADQTTREKGVPERRRRILWEGGLTSRRSGGGGLDLTGRRTHHYDQGLKRADAPKQALKPRKRRCNTTSEKTPR